MNFRVICLLGQAGLYYEQDSMEAILQRVFGEEIKILVIFRDYNFESALEGSTPPDLVLSNGITKTRDESNDCQSYAIYYNVRGALKEKGLTVPVLSPTFFFRYIPWLLEAKLRIFKLLHKPSAPALV